MRNPTTFRTPSLLPPIFLAFVLTGCFTSPDARKQKFYEQGVRDYDNQKYPEAVISLSRALQLDPHFADARYKLAQTHQREGNWTSAVQEFQRTIDQSPTNWHAQIDLGQILLAGQRPQEAKDHALTVLNGDPKNADAEILLSNADMQLNNVDSSLREAQEAIALAPEKAKVYVNLALIQQKSGKDDDAEVTLKKAQSAEPSAVSSYLVLGRLFARQGRWADAVSQFQAAIPLTPHDPQPRTALAAIYWKQGAREAAEKVLSDAKQQVPDDPAIYRLLGDYYMAKGDSAKALSEFGALSVRYPNDTAVRKTYIQLLILNHRLDEASRLNEATLKNGPRDSESLVLRGQIQTQQNHFDDAILTLRQALTADPSNALGHYHLGVAFQRKNQIQEAEGEWHAAVRLRPDLIQAWTALGATAAQRGDWRTLDPIATRLCELAPDAPDGYLFHATAKINLGDSAAAEESLKQLVKLAPQNPLGYVKLGQLRAQQKRWAEAEVYYRQALSHDSNSISAVEGLVALDLRRDRAADAVRLVQSQLDKTPENVNLYLLLGDSQLKGGHVVEAERAFQEAVALNRQNVNAVVALAGLQISQGRSEQGIANYQRAIELAPTNVELYLALGGAYEGQGSWENAEQAYRKALAIRPDFGPAANNLAFLLLEHGGDVNVALSLAQTARRGLPTLPNSADTLGWAYYHGGLFSLAAPLFEDAVKKDPANSTYHYHLGLTYQKLNDPNRSHAELEKAIAINPKSRIADQARQAITQSTSG
jgi:cellulose synthase operon protein C